MPDIFAVPMLDELAAAPTRAGELPPETVEALIAKVLVVQGALFARLVTASASGKLAASPDRLLDVTEAAERLGCSRDWLYRHRKLPFAVRNGRSLRFSSHGIDLYIRNRQGR